MISALVIIQACFNVDVVEKTLRSLEQTPGVLLFVVENKSTRTPLMQQMLSNFRIEKYILMNENRWGNPFLYPAIHGMLDEYAHVPFVCLTDGDITISDPTWLVECTHLLEGVGLVAVDLDTSNLPLWHPQGHTWRVTPVRTEKGFLRAQTGIQMLCMRRNIYMDMVHYIHERKIPFTDSHLYESLRTHHMEYAVTEKARAYHIGWDIYTDIHKKGKKSMYYSYSVFKEKHLKSPPSYTGFQCQRLLPSSFQPGSQHLEKLRVIQSSIPERKFHEHTYILGELLADVKSNTTVEYLEIGVYVGTSASFILSHDRPIHATLVDPCELKQSHYMGTLPQRNTIEKNVKKHVGTNTYRLLMGRSTEKKTQLQIQDRKYDLIFIDGDHSAMGLTSDIHLALPLLKPGGYMVIDDYHDKEYWPDAYGTVNDMWEWLEQQGCVCIGAYLPNRLGAHPSAFQYINEFVIYKKCS